MKCGAEDRRGHICGREDVYAANDGGPHPGVHRDGAYWWLGRRNRDRVTSWARR